jgi:hypothetical protein
MQEKLHNNCNNWERTRRVCIARIQFDSLTKKKRSYGGTVNTCPHLICDCPRVLSESNSSSGRRISILFAGGIMI